MEYSCSGVAVGQRGAFLGTLACWGTYSTIGSEVGVDGVLREPFALIPLGWLCCASAVASGAARGGQDSSDFKTLPGKCRL